MKHIKIQSTPKIWPIGRKKTKFVVKPSSSLKNGISLLTVLRDILQIADNRKEVKKIINEKKVLVNGKIASDEKFGLTLFDVISLPQIKENYKLIISENGKFDLVETKDSLTKVSKVVNKTKLKGNKIQLNFSDGTNIVSDTKCKTNDSVVISFKDMSVKECLDFKEGRAALVFAGKHIGESGKIKEINNERKLAVLNINGKDTNILISQLIITK